MLFANLQRFANFRHWSFLFVSHCIKGSIKSIFEEFPGPFSTSLVSKPSALSLFVVL